MRDLPVVKLLAIDIDGTLLTPDKHVTARTQAAVRAAQEAGVVVTLATARRYCNTGFIAAELDLTIPLILYDGALIVRHPSGEVLHTDCFPSAIAQQAVDIMVQHKIQPVAHHITPEGKEEMWTGPLANDTEWIRHYFVEFPPDRRLPYSQLCQGQPDPLRVVAFAPEEIVYNGIQHDINRLDCSWNAIRRGNYATAELAVMHTGCSKARGLQALAAMLSISIDQTMAIGDNNNDVEMIQVSGWGVAMGHATETVKAVADAITTSNREDGVALAIERYILRLEASADSNALSRETWR